jgi:hypothetical protein
MTGTISMQRGIKVVMSVLAAFKECQKICFNNRYDSKEFKKASDRMDVLWILLSTDEIIETQKYERQLWIDSGKCIN